MAVSRLGVCDFLDFRRNHSLNRLKTANTRLLIGKRVNPLSLYFKGYIVRFSLALS
jgi:hypothetical protein